MTELSKEELKEIKESLTHISELPWCESPGDCIDEPAAVYRIEEDAIHTEIIADNMLGVNAKAVMVIMNASSKIFSTIESLSEQNKEQSKELERLKDVCKMLIGEEVMFQEGKYETEMSKLRDENISLCNQLREAESDIRFFQERKQVNDEVFRELVELNDSRVKDILTKVRALSHIQGKEN